MRTIPTILAAAAIAVVPAVLTPIAHADYVCTGPGGAPISFIGNSNLCYGGGTLITPAAPPQVAQNIPQVPYDPCYSTGLDANGNECNYVDQHDPPAMTPYQLPATDGSPSTGAG
jgi:hypothetical protein